MNAETKIVTVQLGLRSYDIYIGAGILFSIAELLPNEISGTSVFIVTDQNVAAQPYPKTIADLLAEAGALQVHVKVLGAGEQTKSFEFLETLTSWMLEKNIDRQSIVIAIGGGVIGDLTGFAASVVMRGVPFIQIPTTLLAQVDSSVGGKTGINTAYGKNMIGTFYQPQLVMADVDTLKSLPRRELLAGYAECVKHALISDLEFFEWLEENGKAILALDPSLMNENIERNCTIKAAIVQDDEREGGQRALLNLGHTFGHALEAVCGYDGRLLHGEAVSIGMVMAYALGLQLETVTLQEAQRVEAHLNAVGLPTNLSNIDLPMAFSSQDLWMFMQKDKKASKGTIGFVVPIGIGRAEIRRDVPEEKVLSVLAGFLGEGE